MRECLGYDYYSTQEGSGVLMCNLHWQVVLARGFMMKNERDEVRSCLLA
jgi:hypothetical protein